MKHQISVKYSLELIATLVAIAAALGVLQSFIIGQHFVIPTMLLGITIMFGNLARFGYQDSPLAKHILFWLAVITCCHTFFALFWAHTPREMLGGLFLPIYGVVCVTFGVLAWKYAQANRLFHAEQN